MTQYKVTAPCLVHVPFDTPQGRQLGTLYAGAVLPASVPKEKVKFWLDAGMIKKVEAKASPEPEREESGPEGPEVSKSQGPGPVQDPAEFDKGGILPPAGGEQQVKTPERVTPEPVAPPSSGAGATKAAWVDYAVTRGFDREQAEAMSRDDLIKALKPSE